MVVAPRLALLAVMALAFSLSFAPTASAQAAVGPTVLYLDAVAPSGGSAALVFDAPSGADGTSSCIPLCPDTFMLTASSTPLPGAVAATEPTVEAVAWFKSWNNAPSPGLKVVFSLQVDGAEVATGSKTADALLGAIVEFRLAMPYTGPATIPAGSVLTWTVSAVNAACDCYSGTSYPRGVSADHPWSVTLPGLLGADGPAAPILEALEGTTVNVTRAFANETTATYVFNWTGPSTPLALMALANGTGNVSLAIEDGGNSTLYGGNLTSTPAAATINGTAGNWSLTLVLEAFRGNITLVLAEPAQAEGASATTTTSGTPLAPAGDAASEEHGAAADVPVEDVPLPLAVPLVALAAAMLALRRRR